MVVVKLILKLGTGDADFVCVDDNDVVAGVHVRGEDGFVLSTQPMGDSGGQSAEDFVARVDDKPIALDGGRCSRKGLHDCARSKRAAMLRTPLFVVNENERPMRLF